jgi:hypothetical protein
MRQLTAAGGRVIAAALSVSQSAVRSAFSSQREARGRARADSSPRIRTLADLGTRNRLQAHCASCRRSRRLDIQALIRRYGPLPLSYFRARLVCGRCGARGPELIMSWDNSLAP